MIKLKDEFLVSIKSDILCDFCDGLASQMKVTEGNRNICLVCIARIEYLNEEVE